MFKRLFGQREAGPVSQLAVVRNITVGRTVALDPLAWRRLGDETHFSLDRDALEITAQGVVRLDDGPFVHRFYTDDHVMLQAMSDDAGGAGYSGEFWPYHTFPARSRASGPEGPATCPRKLNWCVLRSSWYRSLPQLKPQGAAEISKVRASRSTAS